MGMHVIDREGKSSALLLTLPRKNAPGYTNIVCFGGRVRKDGTCQLCETLALWIRPDKRSRVRLEHTVGGKKVMSEPLSRIARLDGLVMFAGDRNVYRWPGREAGSGE